MFKDLICWFWGHKTVHKAYPGTGPKGEDEFGVTFMHSTYRWVRTPFCTRCGAVIEDPKPEPPKPPKGPVYP